ncbi:MAG: helix-turn-helix domain-containing protein [Trueperaceae bacterium]
MIQNEREYKITRAEADKFTEALAAFEKNTPEGHPKMRKAYRDAMKSQLEELQDQLSDYETLKLGRTNTLAIASLDELPKVLIQARIAAGLSQKDLGEKLGLKEQQIQRYEATLYQSASLTRLLEVTHALEVRLDGHVILGQ